MLCYMFFDIIYMFRGFLLKLDCIYDKYLKEKKGLQNWPAGLEKNVTPPNRLGPNNSVGPGRL